MLNFSRFATAAIATTFGLSAFAKPITAVLRLKEKVALETLAQDVRNPVSSRYGQFYTPNEIRQISGPTDADYQSLLAQLRADGFTIVSESPTHLWLRISADSSVFEHVFSSKIQLLSANLHRAMVRPRIPSGLSLVASVTGLDNTHKLKPRYIINRFDTPASAGGVPLSTIQSAYGFTPLYKAGLTGAGQHIAIATYMGFNMDDVNEFYKEVGISPAPKVDIVAFNGTAAYDEDSAMETQLDTEFSGMMAPGAQIHVFASADNSDAGELAMFTAILDDNRAKIVNYSWGGCETQLDPSHQADMEKVFARAVAQGVNIMVATGDSGSDSCQNGTTAADWPAAEPNVVGVGGTSFGVNNGVIAETAWSGSGGGISALFALPAWQSQLGSPYTKRSYPDVAFNADPNSGQAIYAHNGGTPGWIVIGGTSMAAPQWSGFMALVGEARAKLNKPTLGFLDPIIYNLSAADKKADFHDITTGSNGAYNAGTGWDAVTGWGSMQADALLNTLVNQ